MARFLALDWDHQQLNIVSASVKGGAVRIHKAVSFAEPRGPNLAEAEALGKQLLARLKEAGIAPAPVLACVGRDRLILKDLRYPAVPPHEEPAVVRFQVVKELNDAPDDVVLDYAPAPDGGTGGERRALAMVIRRELLEAYQKLCKAAGVKLVALAPRPLGLLTCLNRLIGTTVRTPAPDPPGATVAVVAVGQPWTEFGVIKGETLAFSRSLATGPALAGEIRRSVAVYGGQSSQNPVRAVYVAGTTEQAELRDRLQQMLGIPVFPFDPFDGAEGPDLPADHRGDFAGAVGLLQSYAGRRALPINFVQPKQPRPPQDPNKRKLAMAAAVIGILLLAGLAYGYKTLAEQSAELERLVRDKYDVEQQLAALEDKTKSVKALDEWTGGAVVWLDELYDVTADFPNNTSLRLTGFTATPQTRTAKDPDVAKMTLKGIVVSDYTQVLTALQNKLGEGNHNRVGSYGAGSNRGADAFRFPSTFTIPVGVAKRKPHEYTARLPESPGQQGPGGRRGGPIRRGVGGGGRLPVVVPGNAMPNIEDIFGEDVP